MTEQLKNCGCVVFVTVFVFWHVKPGFDRRRPNTDVRGSKGREEHTTEPLSPEGFRRKYWAAYMASLSLPLTENKAS